jgi:hypothetical protein
MLNKEQMMRITATIAALALVSNAAMAGFVDERSGRGAQQTASIHNQGLQAEATRINGVLMGYFGHVGWNDPAPMVEGTQTLAMAFARLLPPAHPSMAIEGRGDELLDRQVSWPGELTRLQALEHIADSQGLNMHLVGSTLIVTRASKPWAGNKPRVDVARWEVLPTDTRLASAIERWSKASGYSFRWDAGRHALIEGSHAFTGTFEEAVKGALDTPGIANSAYPLESCVYPNNPLLLRITRKGEQARDCPITE